LFMENPYLRTHETGRTLSSARGGTNKKGGP
jgi:hypothetical protein